MTSGCKRSLERPCREAVPADFSVGPVAATGQSVLSLSPKRVVLGSACGEGMQPS